MRKLIKIILEILDGTPAVYGDRRRGQSVAELALVTPLLIVLLMGLAEVGWFASNYIALLEVTRTGARFGTVQTGNFSPLAWNNAFSEVPPPVPPAPDPDPYATVRGARNCGDVQSVQNKAGFFNLLACVMVQSMDPLTLRDDNGEDDIVVSAFALLSVDRDEVATVPVVGPGWATSLEGSLFPPAEIPINQRQVLVAGRWPTNTNECNVDPSTGNPIQGVDRDPFDYIKDNQWNYILRDAAQPDGPDNRILYEVAGDAAGHVAGIDSINATSPEHQIGFSWFGQHTISYSNGHCIGSEWSVRDVENLMNGFGFELNPEQRSLLPSQGMVMVELFWQHELLLKNPVFNPVFTMLGDRTTIYVWSAFPIPAVEPHIQFN